MRKHNINLNNFETLKFELLYTIIIKITENDIVMQEIVINSDIATQRIANGNINKLINIINKKQKLVKKITILETVFAFSVLFLSITNNFEINKALSNLIRAIEKLKINNIRNVLIENKIYQIVQKYLIVFLSHISSASVSQTQVTVQT